MIPLLNFTGQYFWGHLKIFLLLLVSLFALHWNTVSFALIYWWDSSTYGHGILVLPLCVFLVWIKRSRAMSVQYTPSYLGLSMFVLLSVGWLLGYASDVQIIKQLTFFGMIGATFLSILGWRVTRAYLIPLTLPLFTLPIWTPLLPALQYLTTQVVSFGLTIINVPIYVEDNFIHIPEGKFSIEDVCAGLRYILAALVIALVYVYLYMRRLSYQLIFIGFVILLSMSVNWLRVFIVVLAGHLTNMTHSLVTDHADFGWWLFAVTLIPIFWFGGYLVARERRVVTQNQVLKSVNQDFLANNVSIRAQTNKYITSILLIVTLTFPLAGFYLKERNRQILDYPLADIEAPSAIGEWKGPYEIQMTAVTPRLQGADRQMIAGYKKDKSEINLYLAQYLFQEQGKELIAEYNDLYDSSIWQLVSTTKQKVELPNGSIVEVQEVVINNKSGITQILWYWYSISGITTISPVVAKILQIRDFFSQDNLGSNVVFLSTNVRNDLNYSRSVLRDYMINMSGDLHAVFEEKSSS